MTYFTFIRTTLTTLSLLSFSLSAFAAPKTVGITQIVDHPSLNAIREGILEGLADHGFKEGENLTIVFENAQGNPTIAAQIAKKFASLPLDAIVPITTPSAQTMVQQVKETPIIFAAISDPLAAKVVSSLDHPGGNVTGIADTPPLLQQLQYIRKCLPTLKTLGVIYNPGEANMVAFLDGLKKQAETFGITLVSAAAPKSADVQAATLSLIDRADAFFIGNDNTVISGLEALVKLCLSRKKPLFMSDPDSVQRGALAAYAYDQKQIGKQAGDMVARVLNGQPPGTLPVETPKALKVSVNPATAKQVNVKCPLTFTALE